jgi:UDP-glucose 4-epimerase
LPTHDVGRRPGDPAKVIASNAKAAQLLGWQPARGLDRMIADAWEFLQRRS